jgi:uncharacterized protein (DUF1499 family)
MTLNLRSRLAPLARPAVLLAGLLALVAIALLGLAGPGSRMGLWHWTTGFGVLRWGAYAGIAAVVVALLAGLLAGLAGRLELLAMAVLALLLGATAVAVPQAMLSRARSLPHIHDITTDLEHPPAFQALLALRAEAQARNPPDYDGPQVAALQRAAYPDIAPAVFAEPPPAVFAAVQRTAATLDWRVVAAVPGQGRLEASDTTAWFGFVDDVVVRVAPADGGGTRVDVRSKSRVGGSDLGANARRVRRFLKALRGQGLTPRG